MSTTKTEPPIVDGWSSEVPTEAGVYWCWFTHRHKKPKLKIMSVRDHEQGPFRLLGGGFFHEYDSETFCGWFKKLEHPTEMPGFTFGVEIGWLREEVRAELWDLRDEDGDLDHRVVDFVKGKYGVKVNSVDHDPRSKILLKGVTKSWRP